MIRTIEELSMNAWPPLQTMLYDGWVLRFADGYTNRANSVNPLYPSTRDVRVKIEVCERVYRSRGLSVVFKMTADSQPAELDAILADRGYRPDRWTSVRLLDLGDQNVSPPQDIWLAESASEEWLAAYCRLSGIADRHHLTLRHMLRSIVPARCFVSASVDDRIVACGMGVAQDRFVGLYDIVTDATYRRRGYGQRLVEQILAWAKRQGAQTAYLQVMTDNAPALALYGKLGFREVYPYWYRMCP
jgi:ribosomal protein S18 acetylase RimI-like enzyme